jgi:uncharacterized protein YbaR (Trm112 family)
LHHINRILRNAGYTVLEFPNKDGIRNRFVHRKYFDLTNDDYNSWDVRYYSIGEYKDVFNLFLRNFSFTAHSFIGIGILPEDLKYVSKKNYIPVLVSVILTRLANRFKHFSRFADSIYINASKKDESQDADISEFLKSYFSDSFDNLDILQLIRCPISGKPMVINEDRTKALVPEAGIYYPIIDSIPIIIKSEAISS